MVGMKRPRALEDEDFMARLDEDAAALEAWMSLGGMEMMEDDDEALDL